MVVVAPASGPSVSRYSQSTHVYAATDAPTRPTMPVAAFTTSATRRPRRYSHGPAPAVPNTVTADSASTVPISTTLGGKEGHAAWLARSITDQLYGTDAANASSSVPPTTTASSRVGGRRSAQHSHPILDGGTTMCAHKRRAGHPALYNYAQIVFSVMVA